MFDLHLIAEVSSAEDRWQEAQARIEREIAEVACAHADHFVLATRREERDGIVHVRYFTNARSIQAQFGAGALA